MDSLVADLHAPHRKQLLDVAVAEGEAVVQPHGMADDLGGKAVAPVQRITGRRNGGGRHRLMLRGATAQLVNAAAGFLGNVREVWDGKPRLSTAVVPQLADGVRTSLSDRASGRGVPVPHSFEAPLSEDTRCA